MNPIISFVIWVTFASLLNSFIQWQSEFDRFFFLGFSALVIFLISFATRKSWNK